MASKLPSIEAFSKTMAIEALATCKQVKISKLLDLVRSAPELSDDIGKNARELVSFRILETLFAQGSQNDYADASAICQKVEFNPSDSCENVLWHMLHEMWTSNLKPGAPEILKWDVQAFIAHKRNSLPMVALQKLMDATLEEQIMQEDCYAPLAEPAKNFKLDVHMTECTAVEKLRTSAKDGPLANSSERIVEHIDKKRCNLENEAEIGGMAMEYIGTHDAGNQHAAKKFKQGVNIATLARVVKSITSTGDRLLTNSSESILEHVDREGSNLEKEAEMKVVDNEDFDFDNDGANPFAATDGDEYHDERNDIASQKNAFLSSQCTYSEDSSETQQTLCMKCNSGGQLLYCSSNACPLVVHESCLGFAAKLDGDGRFYCPFCAYSRALSEYLEVKRKASSARKDLSTFIGLKVGNRPKLSMRSQKSKQNPVTGIDELNENHEENVDGDSLNKADHAHRRTNVEDRLQAEPSISHVGNGPPCSEKVLYLTHGELNALENENVEGEGREQEHQSPIQLEEQQIVIFQKSDGDISSPKQADIDYGNGGQALIIRQNDEESSGLKYSMRPRTDNEKCTYPAIPQLRRKRHRWTEAEVEKLKEGVKKFSAEESLSIPWKAIFEFGADVFQKGRTSVDLKDKWRNICKMDQKSE